MIKIKDSRGYFIELAEEELLLALQHGLGVVIATLEEQKAPPRVVSYTKSLYAISKKLRPTHLEVTQDGESRAN